MHLTCQVNSTIPPAGRCELPGNQVVPNYRCYFMGESNRALFTAEIEAEGLEAVKHRAFDMLCSEYSARSMQVRGLEIWEGNQRLHPQPQDHIS